MGDKEYTISEPYQSIGIQNLCKTGQKILQTQLNSLNLEDTLYPVFCSQINHPVFAKQILIIYGETFIEMFKADLYNCIQFNMEEKNNIVCKKIDEIYKKLKLSFQNINITNETESNSGLFNEELAFFGGAEVSISTAKKTVSKFINNEIPRQYIEIVKKILKDKIVGVFETYFHVDSKFPIHDIYGKYLDFKDNDNAEGALKKSRVTSIVNHFLSTAIKKPRTIFGGEGEDEDEAKADDKKPEAKEDDVDNIISGVIINETSVENLIKNNLSCDKIQDYIINGFEKLLNDNIFKHTEEMENIISYAFSELMLHIYENGVYPANMEYNLSYKERIIQNFINNYPKDKLHKLLKTVCVQNKSLLLDIRNRVTQSDAILKQVFKYWNANFTKLVQFFQYKKQKETTNQKESGKDESNKTNIDLKKDDNMVLKRAFFLKFLGIIKPIVMKPEYTSSSKKLNGGNITMGGRTRSKKSKQKAGEGEDTKKRRKPCSKGTRWVEKAQKCMTTDEKKAFMVEKQKNLKNLAHNSTLGTIVESRFEPYSAEEKKEETKEEMKEETKEEMKAVETSFLLEPHQKKCPNGYTQHPKKSRKCVKNEELKTKTSFTRKNVSKVPEIQTEEEIQNAIEEDILEEQHPVEEEIESPKSKKKESKKIVNIDSEKQEYDDYLENPDTTDSHLYPHLLDPNFNEKIASKKEFSDLRYDGEIHDVQTQSQIECKAPFEILPNQQFVKNFLSVQTPYNSLLLYAGLGTGKTCAAIGVTEEMRLYMKQVGVVKKILIVASPNVQANFRLQLFDESRLHELGKKGSGVWNLDTCVGYDLLKEIQTTNMSREYVVRKINTIINEYYDFIGYESLAIYIEEMSGLRRSSSSSEENAGDIDEKKIRQVFDDRLIVIDEVHNIIGKEDDENKHTSNMIMKLVKYCDNLRLLFLSATPMYNSYKEIIWLLNIMNLNDHRSMIRVEQVFNENGEFVEEVKDEKGVVIVESGKDLLKRKLIGYVSYVRGENPYTFPYRIYPSLFAEDENQIQKNGYPTLQMNGTNITKPLQHLDVFITTMGEYQKNGYNLLVQYAKDYIPNFEEKESFGHTVLQGPISALNMIYPSVDFDEYLLANKPPESSSGFMGITSIFGGEEKTGESEESEESEEEPSKESEEESPKESEESPKESEDPPIPVPVPVKKTFSKEEIKEIIHNLHGKNGLNNIISFSKPDANTPLFHDFEYKPEILQKYGRIFQKENIGKYSSKIAKICDILSKSTGIVLIYSKFIEGGLIPMALALEEMGFQRYGEANYTKSLFKQKPVDFVLNPLTMKPNGPTETFSAKYVMITGQKYYSPNNSADLKLVTDLSNKRGEHVRVVLISEAGSEGLDFKNIRQVHILDPWYNINRIEQVIGRAVRNKSHCSLPISERNVEIYMHGTYIDSQTETADLYMYRLAEKKALQIGTVTRVLKETAVDCLLNIGQSNFTQEKMAQNLSLVLSTNQKKVDFAVGDKPFSNMCDYMETCDFTCNGKAPATEIEFSPTYDQYFLQNTHPRISKRIRQLFREKTVFSLDSLVKEINIIKPFPIEQVYYSISEFLKNHEEWLVDKKGRKGYMIQREDTYAFQPLEISNEKASIFERNTPLEYKRKSIPIEMPKEPILTTTQPKIKPKSKVQMGESEVFSDYQVLYSQLQKDLETVLSSSSYVKPLKQNMNWYKYAKLSLRICIDKHKIERKTAVRYVVYHHMDCLDLKDRLLFLNNLLSTFESFTEADSDSIETILKKYFIAKIDQTNPDKKFILLNSKNNNVVYSLTKDSRIWKEEPSFPDTSEWINTFNLRKSLLDKVNAEAANKTECNVGFVGAFKENYGFKIKNLLNTRPKPGALCDQADKQKLIAKINEMLEIMGKTGEVYNKDPVYGLSAIERPNLCVIYEILMRSYTENEKKMWFLSPEQAIASDLEHFIVKAQTIFGFTTYVTI